MYLWLAWLIAIISTSLCLYLWFRDVRRIMRDRMNTVESAARQLTSCREKAAKEQDAPGTAVVLERSKSIYQQAVGLYNQTLRRPWVYLPALLMGFKPIS